MSLRWLPNAISIMRIALIAPILWLIAVDDHVLALALFVVAGFSDGLDGFLAKRYDWHTRLGGLLDPIADKLLMAGLFVTLAATALIPVWLAAAVIARDVVIIGGATAYQLFIGPVRGEPSRVSKLNTALQLLFVVAVLARAGLGWPGDTVTSILGAGVLVTVVISGVDYVVSWSRRARREHG